MIKSALSVLALTVAFSGAAFAQGMMINGVAVSEADQPAVQERCDQLSNAEATESLSPTTNATDASSDASSSGTAGLDATVDSAPAVNEAQAVTASIDLDTISLQACIDGGFTTK